MTGGQAPLPTLEREAQVHPSSKRQTASRESLGCRPRPSRRTNSRRATRATSPHSIKSRPNNGVLISPQAHSARQHRGRSSTIRSLVNEAETKALDQTRRRPGRKAPTAPLSLTKAPHWISPISSTAARIPVSPRQTWKAPWAAAPGGIGRSLLARETVCGAVEHGVHPSHLSAKTKAKAMRLTTCGP